MFSGYKKVNLGSEGTTVPSYSPWGNQGSPIPPPFFGSPFLKGELAALLAHLFLKGEYMYFPDELWRIIKNYQLGNKYWKRKLRKVLEKLQKPWKFNYRIHSAKTRKIRFTKEIETAPFLRAPRDITKIYSIYDGTKISSSHIYENMILDSDEENQILEILDD